MRSHKMRLVTLVVGLALAAGMVPGAMAKGTATRSTNRAAETYEVPTDVTLRYSKKRTTFSGVVSYEPLGHSSSESACGKDRKVTLFKVVRGPDKKLGTKTTSDRFRFVFQRAQRGRFRVNVAATQPLAVRYGDFIVCSAASSTLRL